MNDREYELEKEKLELERQKLESNQAYNVEKDGYATGSLICGCIGFFIPPLSAVGLILGYCSQTPKGAKSGILVSWISFALWVIIAAIWVWIIGAMFL